MSEKALAEYQEAARLEPRTAYPQSNQVGLYRYLERFDEARAVAEKLVAQKLDSPSTHVALLQVAYVQGDQAEAERQIQWLTGKQEEYLSIGSQAANAVVLGQCRRAMGLLERGGEMARRRNLAGVAAQFQSGAAESLALGGNCEEARRKARAATLPDPEPRDTLQEALPLAICGDAATAQKMADDTSKRYPLHTLWKAVWRQAIFAAIELNRNQPEKAIELLQPASAYDRAYFGGLLTCASERGRNLRRSSRRSSITRVRTGEHIIQSLMSAWPARPRSPVTSPAPARPTRISWPCGRTPIPTSRS